MSIQYYEYGKPFEAILAMGQNHIKNISIKTERTDHISTK